MLSSRRCRGVLVFLQLLAGVVAPMLFLANTEWQEPVLSGGQAPAAVAREEAAAAVAASAEAAAPAVATVPALGSAGAGRGVLPRCAAAAAGTCSLVQRAALSVDFAVWRCCAFLRTLTPWLQAWLAVSFSWTLALALYGL